MDYVVEVNGQRRTFLANKLKKFLPRKEPDCVGVGAVEEINET